MALRWRRETPGPFAFLKDFRRVLPYLRPHKRLAFVSGAMIGVSSLMALLEPWPLAILIDTVLGNKPLPSILGPLDGLSQYQLLAFAVGAGLVITGIAHGFAVLDEYVNTKLDLSLVLDLRSEMFQHAQRLSMAYHDTRKTGKVMYQINNQAAAVGAITVAIPPLITSVLTLVGMFYVVYRIQPQLAVIALTVVPFIYYSAGYYARRVEPQLYAVRKLEGDSLSIVHEAMSMMRVIIAFARERFEYGRFREQAEEAVGARVHLTVRQTIFSLAVTMLTATGTALVLAFGAYYVLQSDMTAGELLVVMGYIAAIYKPLEQISNTFTTLQQQFISLRNAFALLDREPEITEKPTAVPLPAVRGAVSFEGVGFAYSGREPALADVSFAVEPGQRVAIVGPTGAGKTTLLGLLSRFHDPKRGCVRIDGHDVRDVSLDSLRSQISIVLQEPLLFSGSIRENIRYGRLEASDDEIVAAAQAANAHDFITALPKGYDTELGERGALLSGGERQRLSVARAFLKDAPILILDEPTSSIDSRTEAAILDALERLIAGRTTFVVAHRLSTVQACDPIVVLNHGRIAEIGTHHELLAQGGLYAELYETQQGSRRRRAAAAVSPEALAEMTTAIAAGRETGDGLTGPALAELAQAMADGGEPSGAVWLLLGAAWPLLHDGSTMRLRELADRHFAPGDPCESAPRMARRLLADLGLEHGPVLAYRAEGAAG